LDAKAAIEAAPLVAELMAAELKKGNEWIKQQEDSFLQVAKNYLSISYLKSQTSNI
jgi:glycerol-3-phosphate dehydrogenase